LPFAARLVTIWTDYGGGKSERFTGKVNGGAPWAATLAPDKDFVGCVDLVIEAALTAPDADAEQVGSKKKWQDLYGLVGVILGLIHDWRR